MESSKQARPTSSPLPGSPPVMPQRKKRAAPVPILLNNNYDGDDDDTLQDSVQQVATTDEACIPGLCTTDVVPWNNAENLHDRIQHRMATSCAGEEGKGSRLIHLASLQQGFAGDIDASTCGRKIPVSWYGTLNAVKERFRSEAMPESCCNLSSTSCEAGGLDPTSSCTMPEQDATTRRAKETLQATLVTLESLRVKAGETIGPVVCRMKNESAQSCMQSEAWCRENIIVLLATDCQEEMASCKTETCQGAYNGQDEILAKGSDPEGKIPGYSMENEKARRELGFFTGFKSAGTSIRQQFAAIFPPHGLEQEKRVIVDLPPDFGHDSKNLRAESPKIKPKDKKLSKTDEDKPNKNKTPELGEDDKIPDEVPEAEEEAPEAKEEVPEVNATQDIQEAQVAMEEIQRPQETQKSTGPSAGPQDPDGDKPVADDLAMERMPRKEVADSQASANMVIDCTLQDDDGSTPVSQGSAMNPILLMDDEALGSPEDSQQHLDKLLALESQSHVSGLSTAAKSDMNSIDTSLVAKSEIQEHLKELVEGYMIRQTKQKNISGAVTVDASKAADELLSSMKSHLTRRSQGRSTETRSSDEQRQSPPLGEEIGSFPILPTERNEVSVDHFRRSLGRKQPSSPTKPKLIADPCKNGRLARDSPSLEMPAVSKPKTKLMADPFKHGIIDADWSPSTHSSEHRDDHQSSMNASYGGYESDSRQGDAYSWLYEDPRYGSRPQVLPSENQKPPLPSPIFRQFPSETRSVSSTKSSMAGKNNTIPKRTKSVSFSLPQCDDASRESAKSSKTNSSSVSQSRSHSSSSSSSSYRDKRAIILARREELAALSKRQAKLLARGQRILQNHLHQSSAVVPSPS